jgi:hypothetical protein
VSFRGFSCLLRQDRFYRNMLADGIEATWRALQILTHQRATRFVGEFLLSMIMTYQRRSV